MVAERQAHGSHRGWADRARPRAGGGRGRRSSRSPLRARADEPARPRARDVPARGLRRSGSAAGRADGVGLRRLRGPDDGGGPRGAAGLDALAGRRAGRRDRRAGRRARRPRARRASLLSTATRCFSRTGTCSASSRRAGSNWSPTRAGFSLSIPRTLSTLGYERETPVVRLWNEEVAARPRK